MEYNRGDKVNYLGGDSTMYCIEKYGRSSTYSCTRKLKPVKGTYVWFVNDHLKTTIIIEHPDGFEKKYFINEINDGFECCPERLLDNKKLYARVWPKDIELCKE